ncbi:MAG: prolyl oligopeptidase family serine peptidase, partial [Phycisphaerae bacterium]|nr:prolyl oligopeptidase family serine peptidase [Gemmatimonadaceae bacterium]
GQTVERAVMSAASLEQAHPGARIRTFVPSWDGRYVALGITTQGDGAAAIVVVDLANGRVMPDAVPDLLTTTSGTRYEVSWLPDGSGFFYPRLAASRAGDNNEQFARGRQFLHRLGTPQSADRPVFGYEVSTSVPMDKVDLPTRVGTSHNSTWMFASVFRSKLNASEHYVAPLASANLVPAWVQISAVDDRLSSLSLRGDTVYALARKDADRGKVVRRVLRAGAAQPAPWETVLPEGKGVLTGYVVLDDGIYITERNSGAVGLLRLAPGAKSPVSVSLPVTGTARLARFQSGASATVSVGSWVTPPHWMIASGDSARALGIDDGYSASASAEMISERLEARSKDGTMVPVSVVYGKSALRNGKLDGTAPLLIDAYGAFGEVSDPSLDPLVQLFVSRGGIYACAHVRGGGELGDAWHLAATRERKQNSVDDMIGSVEHLIAKRYTSAKRVSILGMSFGAIIPGLMMLQRPDLLGAVLYEVGEPDEVRGASVNPTAARNIAEIGDVDTPEGVRLLMKSSAYHQVPEHIALPAVIVHSATGDYNFVAPMLAAKFVARLQKANSSANPVLWVKTPGGHEPLFGASPKWAATALSFILWQTGDPRYQPAR